MEAKEVLWDHLEVTEGILNGLTPPVRTRVLSSLSALPVRGGPDRQAIEFLDIGDPAGLRDEPAVRSDVLLNLTVGRQVSSL